MAASTLDTIASWVQTDILHRGTDTDIQSVCRNAALATYRIICAKVPFDELQFLSPEYPLVVGQDTYTIGGDFIFTPDIRAIANIRITFDSSNRRRLRRSHARVFDALSISPSSRPSTYARFDGNILLNPPPDSAAYTLRFRYWGRPPIGHSYVVTGVTWAGGNATYVVADTTGINNGDTIVVTNIYPIGYQVTGAVVSHTATNIVVAITTNPGTYTFGGILTDTTATDFQNTIMITPIDWELLFKYETLYQVYYALDVPEKAMSLMQPQNLPRQGGSPRKQNVFETGIIPRLWNDLLSTSSAKENVDEDFNINPVIRAYSVR